MTIKPTFEIESAKSRDHTGKGTYLLYANPGMGKTTTAKFLPGKTLVLDIDRTTRVLDGEENIDVMEIDNVNTWEYWSKLVVWLVENKKGIYDNIFVDNISELERCILADLGSQGKNKGVPSQGDYQYMQFKIVGSLRYLKGMDCNLFWTAWEDTDLFVDSSGQQYNRAYPKINKKILSNVTGLCDIVARLMINADGERGYILSATNSTFAKNQIDDRKGCLQNELILPKETTDAIV